MTDFHFSYDSSISNENIKKKAVIAAAFFNNSNVCDFCSYSRTIVKDSIDLSRQIVMRKEFVFLANSISSNLKKNNYASNILHFTKEEFIKKIDVIAKLKSEWVNGNDFVGRVAFSSELIEKVKKISEQLPIFPMVFPTYRNSIQLEYEKKNGEYLEFELFENNRIKKFYMASDKRHYTRSITEKQIIISVLKFYES